MDWRHLPSIELLEGRVLLSGKGNGVAAPESPHSAALVSNYHPGPKPEPVFTAGHDSAAAPATDNSPGKGGKSAARQGEQAPANTAGGRQSATADDGNPPHPDSNPGAGSSTTPADSTPPSSAPGSATPASTASRSFADTGPPPSATIDSSAAESGGGAGANDGSANAPGMPAPRTAGDNSTSATAGDVGFASSSWMPQFYIPGQWPWGMEPVGPGAAVQPPVVGDPWSNPPTSGDAPPQPAPADDPTTSAPTPPVAGPATPIPSVDGPPAPLDGDPGTDVVVVVDHPPLPADPPVLPADPAPKRPIVVGTDPGTSPAGSLSLPADPLPVLTDTSGTTDAVAAPADPALLTAVGAIASHPVTATGSSATPDPDPLVPPDAPASSGSAAPPADDVGGSPTSGDAGARPTSKGDVTHPAKAIDLVRALLGIKAREGLDVGESGGAEEGLRAERPRSAAGLELLRPAGDPRAEGMKGGSSPLDEAPSPPMTGDGGADPHASADPGGEAPVAAAAPPAFAPLEAGPLGSALALDLPALERGVEQLFAQLDGLGHQLAATPATTALPPWVLTVLATAAALEIARRQFRQASPPAPLSREWLDEAFIWLREPLRPEAP